MVHSYLTAKTRIIKPCAVLLGLPPLVSLVFFFSFFYGP